MALIQFRHFPVTELVDRGWFMEVALKISIARVVQIFAFRVKEVYIG